MRRNNDPAFGRIVRDYLSHLPPEDVKWLCGRMHHGLQGDASDAMHFVSRYRELDRYLASASDRNRFFDLWDQLVESTRWELESRSADRA